MITIPKKLLQQIMEHTKGEYPQEACGILAGKDKVVEKVYQMENVSETPRTRYFMKPQEQLRVFKEIRKLKLELLVIYHSHINSPAYPSAKDVELAFYPDTSYLIISLNNKNITELKLFKIREGKINQEKLKIGE